ncbi:MAG: hypothetical protein JNL28_05550 [Planctomycetes bacterium]|nr:hypothetical protein [Planctomycetota bacterium]
MTKNDTPKSEPKTPHGEVQRIEKREAESAPARLDFSKLDLTVEKVEERISPSETNVFDK